MKKHLLSKILLLSALLGGANSVWAQDVLYELDGTTQGWVQACNTAEKIDVGRIRTIIFTVDALKNNHDNFAGYMINLTTTATAPQWTDQSKCRLAYRAFDWYAGIGGSGQLSYVAKSTDNNDLTQVGDVVVATIEHKNNGNFRITYKVTRNGTKTTHYYECQDNANPRPDTYVFLCADQAKLSITSDVTKYSVDGIEGDYNVSTTVGNEGKTSGWDTWTENSLVFKKGQTYKVSFTNHGQGASGKNYYNWVLKFNHNSTDFCVRADYYAFTGGTEKTSYFVNRWKYSTDGGTNTTTPSSEPNDGWWTQFKTDLEESQIELYITYTTEGKIVINGTMTSITNPDHVYYYNYNWTEVVSGDVELFFGVDNCYLENISSSAVANTGANGITTFSSSYHLNLDGIAGATAYSVLETDASSAKLTTATGNVAAGEGLFLKGETNAEVTIPLSSAGSAISGNMLVGSPVASTINNLTIDYDNIYVLGASDGKLHNVASYVSSNTLTIPACKAFLRYSGDSNARDLSLIFDDAETTGIQAVEKKLSDNALYFDLMGRRIAQPTKGLYIVNGKKIIVK